MQVNRKRKRCGKTTLDHSRPRSGRPLRRASQLKANKKDLILDKLRNHHAATQRKMSAENDKLSTLEKLPIELIQQIFFHALEVNLPRASIYLRQVLSTEAIYNALIMFAYFDDDGVHPVETKHFLPAEYRCLSCEEKIELQESILSCRWCTFERVSSCLCALSRLGMVQAWYAESDEIKQIAERTDVSDPIVSNELIRDIAPLPNLDDQQGLEQHFLASTTTDALGSSAPDHLQSHRFLPRIITWSLSLDEHTQPHKGIHRSLSILAARHIPDRLLRNATQSGDDLAFIQLLRQGYTFIQNDHVMSISAAAMFDGMRSAIRAGSTLVLKILLEMHNAFFKSGAWTFQTMMFSQLTPPSNHPLPVDLFHIAVGQGESATELVKLLLRAGIDSLPQDDEITTAWAVHEAKSGNELASWLLKHMEGTRNYGLPRRGHLFVDGCLSWRVRAREEFPFEEVSFATELGYIAGATTIVPAGPGGDICGLTSA